LRKETKADLLAQLKDLEVELALLRVAKITGGAPKKLSKIKVVRLSIVQVRDFSETEGCIKGSLQEVFSTRSSPKEDRAIRRRLTKHHTSLKQSSL
jgi:large subunit ribosomal protein L35e